MDITREMLESKVEVKDWPEGGYVFGFYPMIGFRTTSDELADGAKKIAAHTAWEILNWSGDADAVFQTVDGKMASIKEAQGFLRDMFSGEFQAPVAQG